MPWEGWTLEDGGDEVQEKLNPEAAYERTMALVAVRLEWLKELAAQDVPSADYGAIRRAEGI